MTELDEEHMKMFDDGNTLAFALVTATLAEDDDTAIQLLRDIPLRDRPALLALARIVHRLLAWYAEETEFTPVEHWQHLATEWGLRLAAIVGGEDPDEARS